jgi:hypothetical protein
MNVGFKRIWKEVVIACFKLLSWNSPGGTEEDHENLSQHSPSRGQDSN